MSDKTIPAAECFSIRSACDSPIYAWDILYDRLRTSAPVPSIRLDVVRHAESVANAKGLVAGKWDAGLSKRGHVQAMKLAWLLRRASYKCALSSSLTRTTATLFYASYLPRASLLPLCRDARLDERSLGELERKPRRFLVEYSLGDLKYAPPGGESYLELTQRVLSFLVDLRDGLRSQEPVLIATHVGPMRVMAAVFEDIADPACMLKLNFPHARPYHFNLANLSWPKFLDPKEVLGDRQAKQSQSYRIASAVYP